MLRRAALATPENARTARATASRSDRAQNVRFANWRSTFADSRSRLALSCCRQSAWLERSATQHAPVPSPEVQIVAISGAPAKET